MAVKTTLEELEEVQAAITKVMAGQSVTIGRNSYAQANLVDLTALQESIRYRYNVEQGNIASRTYARNGGRG